jgi:hypothetical protein
MKKLADVIFMLNCKVFELDGSTIQANKTGFLIAWRVKSKCISKVEDYSLMWSKVKFHCVFTDVHLK